jgi:trans-aconitate 2-methyltransferase
MPERPPASWDPSLYQGRHSYVWRLAEGLIDLLAPEAGERILDLGCGTGELTAKIAERGAVVIGVDNSTVMLDKARAQHPHLRFEQADATGFRFPEPFDAVFSNACLHWVRDAEAAVRAIAAALRPGGRFVAEFGGAGNCREIVVAVRAALGKLGRAPPPDWLPWYFPSVGEYASLLERHGLAVAFAELFDRPTELEGGDAGLRGWMEMFGGPLLAHVPADQRPAVVDEAQERCRRLLFRDGKWFADYRRLRVKAVRR